MWNYYSCVVSLNSDMLAGENLSVGRAHSSYDRASRWTLKAISPIIRYINTLLSIGTIYINYFILQS